MINYEKWCRRCENYKFDQSQGILCKLTDKKPQFEYIRFGFNDYCRILDV